MRPHAVRSGKVCDRTPDVYATRQSDSVIVPEKLSNKGLQPVKTGHRPAEMVEERYADEGELG